VIIVVVTQLKSTTAVEASVSVDRCRAGLDELWARCAPAFRRIETRRNAKRLALAMMAHLERRNCWTLAEQAGETGPWRFQHLLSRAAWDDAQVRSEIRAFASERLDTGGLRVLAVDETGDVKKGAETVGVQRQYSGTAGRIENCQIAVYLALATTAGHAAVDARLYLPRVWADDPDRRSAARVPDEVRFATKPELAADMIDAALDDGVRADFATGDEAYGINPGLRHRLRARGLAYALAVAYTTPVLLGSGKATAEEALKAAGEAAWQTRSARVGAKGHRRYDWAWIDLETEHAGHKGLLARRNRSTGELAYYLTWTPESVPLQTLVTVAGMRWRIEETFQGAKELAALDEHQVRTWTSWHRWVTLAMLAYAFLAATRARETDRADPDMIPLTCNEIRHLLVSAITHELGWEHRTRWSAWRRRHQATAKRLHYQRQHALAA